MAFSFFHGTLRDTLKKSRGKHLVIVPLLHSKFPKEYFPLNGATSANLQVNKRTLKLRPFLNKVYGFRFYDQFAFSLALHFCFMIGSKKLASLSQPIRNSCVPKRDSLALFFPRFASATRDYLDI